MIKFKYNDGGRSKYFKGISGDCGTRAICNATGKDYMEVYEALRRITKNYGTRNTAKTLRIRSTSPREGTWKEVMKEYLENELGFTWVSKMGIGTGMTVHVREDELPKGNLILSLSRHYSCVKDGVLYDTYDCSREGTRGVYGYWIVK